MMHGHLGILTLEDGGGETLSREIGRTHLHAPRYVPGSNRVRCTHITYPARRTSAHGVHATHAAHTVHALNYSAHSTLYACSYVPMHVHTNVHEQPARRRVGAGAWAQPPAATQHVRAQPVGKRRRVARGGSTRICLGGTEP